MEADVESLGAVNMLSNPLGAIFLLLACPLLLAGPLIVYLVGIGWPRSSPSRRIVTAIVLVVLALISLAGISEVAEWWWLRLIMLAGLWVTNLPIIMLIALLRRSDRDVKAAARELAPESQCRANSKSE